MNIKKSALCLFLSLLFASLSCNGFKISLYKKAPRDELYQTDLSNYYDDIYTGDVFIGSYKQLFRLIFDTSTSDVFVQSENCIKPGCRFSKYNHKKSFTYKPVGTKVSLTTHGMNLEGMISQDTFQVGRVIVRNTRFAEMNRGYDKAYQEEKYDGVIGMNFERKALGEEVTPFARMFELGLLPKKVFSFWLSRAEHTFNSGFFFLGETNSDYYEGNLTYVDVSKKGYWQVKVDEINVMDSTGIKICTKGCQASIDTGIKNVFGPKEEVEQLIKLIGAKKYGKNGWQVPCNTVDSLPALLFTMNGKQMTLSGEDYTYTDKKRHCIVGLGFIEDVTSRANGADWVLGNVFNRMWYTEFDGDNRRIGFAPSRAEKIKH